MLMLNLKDSVEEKISTHNREIKMPTGQLSNEKCYVVTLLGLLSQGGFRKNPYEILSG
jgi:hypothetical protein